MLAALSHLKKNFVLQTVTVTSQLARLSYHMSIAMLFTPIVARFFDARIAFEF
jgi:hypothetical protein